MTLEQGAALAEIISSIAVIASLIFVGFQVRDSNRESRARAIQDAMKLEMDYTLAFASAPATWDKVVKGQDLDDVELRRAILLCNAFMCETESRFNQYKLGFLEQQTWDARIESLRGFVKLPIFSQWRHSFGGTNHSPEFLKVVDKLMEAGMQSTTGGVNHAG